MMMRVAVVFLSAVGTTASAEVSFDDDASLSLLQVAAVRPVWHSMDLNPAPEHLLDLEVSHENAVISLASASTAVKPEASATFQATWHSIDLNPAPQHASAQDDADAAVSFSSVAAGVWDSEHWHSADHNPVLPHAATPVVAQDSAVSLASGSAALNIEDAAESASLSEDGYSAVAALGNRELMRAYVRRVAKDEGLRITNDGALSGALAYYTGECSTQSYAALVRELYRGTETAKCKQAWVEHIKASSLLQTSSSPHSSASNGKPHSDVSSSTEDDEPDNTWRWAEDLEDSLGVLESELMNLKTAVMENEEKELMNLRTTEADSNLKTVEAASNHVEQKVSLNQAGYEQLAAKGNTTEMALFARRVAALEGFKVTNAKPLAGMSRYYSGECATQSFHALVSELHRVAGRKTGRCGGGPWLIEE